MKRFILLIATVFSAISLFAEQKNGIVYVKPGANGTGSSWTDALGDIQAAINLAKSDNLSRKDVWVAAGDFTINTCITLADSVNVVGSFAGTETDINQRAKLSNGKPWDFANPTTLNGSGARLIQATASMDMETLVDGFIMKNGNGIGTSTSGSGGAALIRPNVILNNCMILNSVSTAAGGGIMMNNGGTVRSSLIQGNKQTTGSNGGGGIFCNTSTSGMNGYIENCEITGNTSNIRGAGIGIQGNTNTYIKACKIYNNKAIDGTTLKGGAGIYVNSGANQIVNCIFYNNTGSSAVYYAGGSFYNNTIARNIGGFYLSSGTNATNIANNIVWGCATDGTGTTATSITGVANSLAQVENNITYNPLPTDKSWNMTDNLLFSSNVSNGDVPEAPAGTVGSGPKFNHVSRFYGAPSNGADSLQMDSVDWNINNASPCLNTGKAIATVTSDFNGLSRPQGFPQADAKYDIGACELPYYIVVAGESATANGALYSSEGILIPENSLYGYAKGSQIEYLVQPNTGYKANKIFYTLSTDGGTTFTGEQTDVTANIDQDGFIKLMVNASFKVSVEWASLTALPKVAQNRMNILVLSDGIQLTDVENGEQVQLLNASGILIDNQTVKNNMARFHCEQPGLYIVRINKNTQKVVF